MDSLQRISSPPTAIFRPQERSWVLPELKYPQHPQLKGLSEDAVLKFGDENLRMLSIISRSEYHHAILQLKPKYSYVDLPGRGRICLPVLMWRRVDLFSYVTQWCRRTFSSCYVEGFYSGGAALKILFGQEAYPKISDVDVKLLITTNDMVRPEMIACMVTSFFEDILLHQYHLPPQFIDAYFSKEEVHTVVYSKVLLATVAIGEDDWTLQFRAQRMHTVAAKSWLVAFEKPYALVMEGTAEEACEDVLLGRVRTQDPQGLRGKGVYSLWDLMTQGWFPASPSLHQGFSQRAEEELLAHPNLFLEYAKIHRDKDLTAQMAFLLTLVFDFYSRQVRESVLQVLLGTMACWWEQNAVKIEAIHAGFFEECLKQLEQAWCGLQWHLLFCGQKLCQAVPRLHEACKAQSFARQGYGFYPLRYLVKEVASFPDAVYLTVQENFELLCKKVHAAPHSPWSSLSEMPSSNAVENLGKAYKTGNARGIWEFLFGSLEHSYFLYHEAFAEPSCTQVREGLTKVKTWMQKSSYPIGGVEMKIMILQLLEGGKAKIEGLSRFWALLGQVPCVGAKKREALLGLFQVIAQVAHLEEGLPFQGVPENAPTFCWLSAYYMALYEKPGSDQKQILTHFSKLKIHHAEVFDQEAPLLLQHLLKSSESHALGELLLEHSDHQTKKSLLALRANRQEWDAVVWKLSEGSFEDKLMVAQSLKEKMPFLQEYQPVWLASFLLDLVHHGKRRLAAFLGNQAYLHGGLSCRNAWKFIEALKPKPGSRESLLVEEMYLELCRSTHIKMDVSYPWIWGLLRWSFDHAVGAKLLLWMQMQVEIAKIVRDAPSWEAVASFYVRCALLKESTAVQLEQLGAFLLFTWIEAKKTDQAVGFLEGLWEGVEARQEVEKGVIAQPLFDQWGLSDLTPDLEVAWLKLAWKCGRKYLIPVANVWRRRKQFGLCLAQAVQWCALDSKGLDVSELDECLLWVMKNLADPKEREALPFTENIWWAERALRLGQKLPSCQLQQWCHEVLASPEWNCMEHQALASSWRIFVAEAIKHQWLTEFLRQEAFAKAFLDSCESVQENVDIDLLEGICRTLERLNFSSRKDILIRVQALGWVWFKRRSRTISRRESVEGLLGATDFFCFSDIERSRLCLSILVDHPFTSISDLEALRVYLDHRNVKKLSSLDSQEEKGKIAGLLHHVFQHFGDKEEAFSLWRLAIHLQTSLLLPHAEVEELVIRGAQQFLNHWNIGPRVIARDVLLRMRAEYNMSATDYNHYALGRHVYCVLVKLLQSQNPALATHVRWEVFKVTQGRLFSGVITLASRACPNIGPRAWVAVACSAIHCTFFYLFMSNLYGRRET